MDGTTDSANCSFEPYRRQVFAWAYRLLGNPHDAEDVVQDVFVRWDRQCRGKPPRHARGWLRRVTLNRTVDVCRDPRRIVRSPADGDGEPETMASDPSAGLDREALRAELAAAMDGLTEMQRSVVIAKVYDGLTFAEVAAEHELAVSTVKTHWLRAIRSLADSLKEKWADHAHPGVEPARGHAAVPGRPDRKAAL